MGGFQKGSSLIIMLENSIYCGDCKDVLRDFPDESVDLIYIDPPFFTSKNYEVVFDDGYEIRGFQDAHWYRDGKRREDIFVYLDWLKEKVEEYYRVLKASGSLYLHCDWHADSYIRVYVLDAIFGREKFRNEIIWGYTGASSPGQRQLPRKHEKIYWYSKGSTWTFNEIRIPYSNSTKQRIRAGSRGGKSVESIFHGRRTKRRDAGGKIIEDWWNIPTIGSTAKERLGYPTQKPERLLERVIQLGSRPNEVVLDPMCGCGTTLVVAHRLNRRWIGIDISPTGCKLMRNRLRENFDSIKINPPPIIGLPMTRDGLREMNWSDFQNWVCEQISGRSAERKVRDRGIDGWTYEGFPIQVKQSENVGRPEVDKFETALRRYYAGSRREKRGLMIAFSFSSGAYDEASRARLENGLDIALKTVEEIKR